MADPEKSASQYLSRLFEKAGIPRGNEDVFHSLRGEYIAMATAQKVDPKTRRMQVGHDSGGDEHDRYGFKQLPEEMAEQLSNLELPKRLDFSMYEDLDFAQMHKKKRRRGRTVKSITDEWEPHEV